MDKPHYTWSEAGCLILALFLIFGGLFPAADIPLAYNKGATFVITPVITAGIYLIVGSYLLLSTEKARHYRVYGPRPQEEKTRK